MSHLDILVYQFSTILVFHLTCMTISGNAVLQGYVSHQSIQQAKLPRRVLGVICYLSHRWNLYCVFACSCFWSVGSIQVYTILKQVSCLQKASWYRRPGKPTHFSCGSWRVLPHIQSISEPVTSNWEETMDKYGKMGTLIERARTITKLFPIHILMSWCLSESSWRTISFRDIFSACVCSQRPQLQLWNSWVCRGLPRLTAASCSKSWRSFRKFASRQNFGAVCVGDAIRCSLGWKRWFDIIVFDYVWLEFR